MQVAKWNELREAVRRREQKIVVTDRQLARSVKLLHTLRNTAVVLVVIILAVAVIIVANPLQWSFLITPVARIVKNILVGVGLILIFAEYLVPVVRIYRIASQDSNGLHLIPRRRP